MQASQALIRTHQEVKIKALRNVVINISTGQAPDVSLQHLLLNFVDAFTKQHLRILKLFQNPIPPANVFMGGLSTVLEQNFQSCVSIGSFIFSFGKIYTLRDQ